MSEISSTELAAAARRIGTEIGDGEAAEIGELASWMADQIDVFMERARLVLPPPERVPGRRLVLGAPSADEDPLNAIVRWADVVADEDQRTSDLLLGKRIALKDLICVAGLPITAATHLLDGYLPDEDAVIVERILRAGGQIVAFTNLEGMAFGGGGESGVFGATANPFDRGRSASGSSGGSAAALYYDGIDIAFGTDQGGSIRQPAAWCGVIGLKPTHGLVPYTGVLSHDPTIDHIGPMARAVRDVALAMEAVAGGCADDARQAGVPATVGGFVEAVDQAPSDLTGLRLGVLVEATESDGSADRDEVLAAFEGFCATARELGAEVVPVSIPIHRLAGPMMFAAMAEGIAATLHGHGDGYHRKGRYSPSLRRAIGAGLVSSGAGLPPGYRAAAAVGEHMRVSRFGAVYATARRVADRLTTAYDRALQGIDALVMPTTPGVAMPLSTGMTMLETQLRSFSMGSPMPADTPAHNLTGHPALSIPAAEVRGLPCGIMLVGPHFGDQGLLRLARTWERTVGWRPLIPAETSGIPDGGRGGRRDEEEGRS